MLMSQMREMYIDEFGRPVSPSMAAQYSPPHEHIVPMYPLPPVLPHPPTSTPPTPMYGHQLGPYNQNGAAMTPPHMSQPIVPHPNFFPVFFGHPGEPMGRMPLPVGIDAGGPTFGVSYPPLYHQGVDRVPSQSLMPQVSFFDLSMR